MARLTKKTISRKTDGKMNKPVWLKYTEQEVKDIILNLIKKQPELTSEKIGLILRDNYGIPKTRIYGFKIGDVLREANAFKSPDMENLNKKLAKIEAHLVKNKKDNKTKRAFTITKAKIKTAEEYKKER